MNRRECLKENVIETYAGAVREHPRVSAVGAASLTLAIGSLTGQEVGQASTAFFPLRKAIAPGVEATAQPQSLNILHQPHDTYVELPIFLAHLPSAKSGAVLKVFKLDTSIKIPTLRKDVATIAEAKTTIIKPFQEKLVHRQQTYGDVGMGAALVIGATIVGARIHGRRTEKNIKESITAIEETPKEERPENIRRALVKNEKALKSFYIKRRIIRAFSTLATTAAIVTGVGLVDSYQPIDKYAGKPLPVPEYVKDGSPDLQGMTIQGRGAATFNSVAASVRTYIDNAETGRQIEGANAVSSLTPFVPLINKWRANKYVILAEFHGADCNSEWEKSVLKPVLNLINPDITIATGDTDTSNGAYVLQPNCLGDLLEVMKKGAPVVFIGNHDNADWSNPALLSSQNNYQKIIKNVLIKGIKDARTHGPKGKDPIKGQTPAFTQDLEDTAIAKVGSEQAAALCQAKRRHIFTVSVADEARQNDESLVRGCANLSISGHGFEPLGHPEFEAYKVAQTAVYNSVDAAAAGEFGPSPIAPAGNIGDIQLFAIDTANVRLADHLSVITNADDTAEVSHPTLPEPRPIPYSVKIFVRNNSPTVPAPIAQTLHHVRTR